MSNLMTKIFIGYVEEIIYRDGRPTLELRVRIPSVHGTNSSTGLKKEDLPIAKPIFMPGATYRTQALEQAIESVNKVFVIFESGDQAKPVYFGVKGNEDLYEIPSDRTQSNPIAPSVTRENKTFVGSTDPANTQNVVNGDLWFDTSDNGSVPDGEPDTLESPNDPDNDIDDIIDTI